MTTTSGMPAVTAALTEAVDAARAARSIPFLSRRARLPWALVGADILAASATGVLAAVVPPAAWSPAAKVALVAAWPIVVALCGGYSSAAGSPDAVRPRTLVRAAALAGSLAWAAVAVAPALLPGSAGAAARSAVVLLVTVAALSVLLRLTASRLVPMAPRRVVLVGEAAGLRPLLHEARRAATARRPTLLPVAVCLHDQDASEAADLLAGSEDLTLWSGTDDLVEVVRGHDAHAVVVAPGTGIGHAELRRWAAWLQDCDIDLMVGSGLRDVAPSRLDLARLGGLGLLRVRPAAITGPTHLLKGLADRVAAALLLVLFAPLLLVLALLIRHDSPGRALYTQTRIGRHGRPFTVYKLRTMCADADRVVDELVDDNESDHDGVLFKIRRDPRITRLGGLLRKYSLDELPQLLNVLRGEMSLIGPRPALPAEVRGYEPDLTRRLVVKPGLTGLWQVSGRSDLSWDDTVRLDLQYVDNWSWSLDLRIAMRTFGAVLGHKGAY